MKKVFVFGTAAVLALAMSSCKSGESAYKKAYEKSQAQEAANKQKVEAETTAPVAVTPVQTTTTTTTTPDYNNVSVRTEDVSLVAGSGLKAYSVVVGSFGVESNAMNLHSKLKGAGYDAQVAKSTENMFRVIISTHNDKASAVQMRDKVKGQYAGAWLLYKK